MIRKVLAIAIAAFFATAVVALATNNRPPVNHGNKFSPWCVAQHPYTFRGVAFPGGIMRAVTKKQACRSYETRIIHPFSNAGTVGVAGANGAAGPVGPMGATGAPGAAGAKGETGAAGAAGAKGDTGAIRVPGRPVLLVRPARRVRPVLLVRPVQLERRAIRDPQALRAIPA